MGVVTMVSYPGASRALTGCQNHRYASSFSGPTTARSSSMLNSRMRAPCRMRTRSVPTALARTVLALAAAAAPAPSSPPSSPPPSSPPPSSSSPRSRFADGPTPPAPPPSAPRRTPAIVLLDRLALPGPSEPPSAAALLAPPPAPPLAPAPGQLRRLGLYEWPHRRHSEQMGMAAPWMTTYRALAGTAASYARRASVRPSSTNPSSHRSCIMSRAFATWPPTSSSAALATRGCGSTPVPTTPVKVGSHAGGFTLCPVLDL